MCLGHCCSCLLLPPSAFPQLATVLARRRLYSSHRVRRIVGTRLAVRQFSAVLASFVVHESLALRNPKKSSREKSFGPLFSSTRYGLYWWSIGRPSFIGHRLQDCVPQWPHHRRMLLKHLIKIDNSAPNGFHQSFFFNVTTFTDLVPLLFCVWVCLVSIWLGSNRHWKLSSSSNATTLDNLVDLKMSVARPTETGCRLVRIKRVPSSEFQNQHPIYRKNQSHPLHHLPPITLRNSSAPSGVNRIWINQRHSDAWCNASRYSSIESSSSQPYYHQVTMSQG